MSTPFNMTKDIAGYNGFGLPISDLKYGVQLAVNTEQHMTLPASTQTGYNNWLVIFSTEAGANVWVGQNVTAVIPTGTLGSANCELNPTARKFKADGNQVISLITSDTTAYVGFTLYAIP